MKLKTPKELGLTKVQFLNLCKLIAFVRTCVPPPKFDITSFHSFKDEAGDRVENINPSIAKYEDSCGTSACFCGYGPLAGIRAKKGESWWQYGQRVFGADHTSENVNTANTWEFLFSDEHVNTKNAACLRGAYLLTHGLPELNGLKGETYDLKEVPSKFKKEVNWELIDQYIKENSKGKTT